MLTAVHTHFHNHANYDSAQSKLLYRCASTSAKQAWTTFPTNQPACSTQLKVWFLSSFHVGSLFSCSTLQPLDIRLSPSHPHSSCRTAQPGQDAQYISCAKMSGHAHSSPNPPYACEVTRRQVMYPAVGHADMHMLSLAHCVLPSLSAGQERTAHLQAACSPVHSLDSGGVWPGGPRLRYAGSHPGGCCTAPAQI